MRLKLLLSLFLIPFVLFAQQWETIATLPGNSEITQIHYVSDTEIYVSSRFYEMHRWNGTEWISVGGFETNFMNHFQYVTESEIYATRNNHLTGNGTTEYNYIAHWDGSSWRNLGNLNTDETIYNFKVISENEVYAVGEIDDINGNRWYSVVKFDGTSWSVVGEGDSLYGTYGGNNSIWVNNSDDIYSKHDGYRSGGVQKVKHWNGTNWSLLSNANDEIDGVDRIHVVSSNEIYTNTRNAVNNLASIGYWNGTYWSILGDIQEGLNTGSFHGSLDFWYVSPNEIYAVGSALRDRNTFQYHVGYWNGTNWRKLGNLAANNPVSCLFYDEDTTNLYVGGYFTEGGKTLIKKINTQQALSVDPVTQIRKPNVFPNPTSGMISLSQEFESIEIYNILGVKLFSRKNQSKIDLSDFTKGIYLLKMRDKLGNIFSQKVVRD